MQKWATEWVCKHKSQQHWKPRIYKVVWSLSCKFSARLDPVQFPSASRSYCTNQWVGPSRRSVVINSPKNSPNDAYNYTGSEWQVMPEKHIDIAYMGLATKCGQSAVMKVFTARVDLLGDQSLSTIMAQHESYPLLVGSISSWFEALLASLLLCCRWNVRKYNDCRQTYKLKCTITSLDVHCCESSALLVSCVSAWGYKFEGQYDQGNTGGNLAAKDRMCEFETQSPLVWSNHWQTRE